MTGRNQIKPFANPRTNAAILAAFVVLALPAMAAPKNRPQSWLRKGELPGKPIRTTDALPLSDQNNEGDWVRFEPMSDEFDAAALDETKWWPNNPRWLGRKPAYFWDRNVTIENGKLCLTMRKEEAPGMPRDKGYHTYTSAAVQSKTKVRYGYFEIRAKPMKSAGSSSFWFYHNTPERWTEIDVFEIGGAAPGFEKKYNMNVHVFHTPTEKDHWSAHAAWIAPANLADDYHVYALEWDQDRIRWYFDGVLVRWVENTHWHQKLTLNFDSETMPDWFGMPDDDHLPSTYRIDYVRAWKRKQPNADAGLQQ